MCFFVFLFNKIMTNSAPSTTNGRCHLFVNGILSKREENVKSHKVVIYFLDNPN